MTNIYVRILRDSKWQNLMIDELTATEVDQFIADQSREKHPDVYLPWNWVRTLVKYIRENPAPTPTEEF